MIGMPYILTGLAAVGFASGWWVHGLHFDSQELARQEGQQAALDTAAMAIAKINVEQVTINSKVREVVRENTIYRACALDDRGMQLLQQAYGAEPVVDGELPTAGSTDRPDVGRAPAGRD